MNKPYRARRQDRKTDSKIGCIRYKARLPGSGFTKDVSVNEIPTEF